MDADTPSLTAAGVAIARAFLPRASTATGDADTGARLAELLTDRIPTRAGLHERRDFLGFLAARTRFIDDAVLDAQAAGVSQIVILGAGYDDRPLRFRAPSVRFFEVDHPATQADKRRLLASIGASADDVTFVAQDFTLPGLAEALARAGLERSRASLFICEGVLRYLPEQSFRDLLRATAEMSAPDSALAATISTSETPTGGDPATEARERRIADAGEPVLTVPTRDTTLIWLSVAGWTNLDVQDVADLVPGTKPGRLLVRASV
jgi:methyltransferase (TIGR00027 family)